ncbi:MAG TPA: ABC transporter permease, partial [Gemmataceae bacterium]|nr:ABC transporter permease [Gemmataceae bacterium]
MIRTMLWKEYREHRLIWLTMLVVNCGVLVGLSEMDQMLFSPQSGSKLMMLGPVAALLVWGYGMVCGAMLLAGEREEGTLAFLDTLPVSRLRLWLVKGQIGLLLLVGQIVALCGCLAVLRATDDPTLIGRADSSLSLWPYALGMLVLGLVGMAYALFFSARGENVLHTIGLALVGQIIAWITAGFSAIAFSILVLIILNWLDMRRNPGPILGSIAEGPIMVYSVFCGMTLAAAVGSARIFSREDRQRRPVAVRRLRARASLAASWWRIVWLCYRQMFRLALGVLVFSLFLGVLFLLIGPLLWPAATLCLGVLCGVTVFSDEQTLGSFRFLGDQRFPLGRIWVIKTGLRFVLLLLASFLILLPSLLVAVYYGMTERHEPPLIREMPYLVLLAEVAPWPTFLLMWLLYGFCAGQLCSLLSRKSIVAAMIAFMISALLVVV